MDIDTLMYLFSLFITDTKTTAAPTPTLATKTTVSKSDPADPQNTTTKPPKVQNTTRRSTFQSFKNTLQSSNSERPGKADPSHLGLAVSLGVLGTLVVCLVAFIACMWRCSRASNVSSRDVEAKIEICDEPSTSSQERSPSTTKRSQR